MLFHDNYSSKVEMVNKNHNQGTLIARNRLMKIFIKNMISTRCKLIVESELENAGLKCISIDQGTAEVDGIISQGQLRSIGIELLTYGLELLDNKRNIVFERIKEAIAKVIYHSDKQEKTNFPEYLSTSLKYDYTYLANIFSEILGITIEQYIILQKIQFAKQLIRRNELNLTEISWLLHYSSVAHLSAQFKKTTGVTPTQFKLEYQNVKMYPELSIAEF
ncbi:MAG: Helix-turn-helix protein [Mucilaginibacter sp.]|nr:Helix-turn-helix protein [Mucilaginibacter sp.]